jgi:hypothetical protein
MRNGNGAESQATTRRPYLVNIDIIVEQANPLMSKILEKTRLLHVRYVFPQILIIAAVVVMAKRHSFDQFKTKVLTDRRAVVSGLIVTLVVGVVDVVDASRLNIQNVASMIVGFILRFLLVSALVHCIGTR